MAKSFLLAVHARPALHQEAVLAKEVAFPQQGVPLRPPDLVRVRIPCCAFLVLGPQGAGRGEVPLLRLLHRLELRG